MSEVAKEPTTNRPGFMVTALPTTLTMPQYSCPIGVGPSMGCNPRYGHRSDPHTQVSREAKPRVGWFLNLGVISVFEPDVAGSVKNCAFHCSSLPFIYSVGSSHLVSRLLVELVPLVLYVRLVDLFFPVLGPDFLEADGDGLFALVENVHNVFGYLFREPLFL